MAAVALTKIEPARPEDEPVIRGLLREAKLPDDDFAAHLGHFLVARHEATVVGAVGYERHGSDGLLRSLVVHAAWRRSGLGRLLVTALTEKAKAAGLRRFYLLTQTAEEFFKARGYQRVDRTEVPSAMAQAPEFKFLCPASAVCLTREISA